MRARFSRIATPSSAAYGFGGLLAVWLLLAALTVDIDYYDGLSAICNARYFLGHGGSYIFDRGPLMAWLLMPAEWLKGWLGLHPLDLRPHHVTTALVHMAYLAAVYRGMVRSFGRHWAVIAAAATAIASFMFVSYAPFLSHDLAPGAIFLWMVIWSEDLARTFRPDADSSSFARRWRLWLALVAAGALAPLVKQTYGVIWIAVLGAHLLSTLLRHDEKQRASFIALAWLCAGAAFSALLAWGTYGVVLAGWAPALAWWMRPYRNLQYLAGVYDGTDVTFPVWIYFRNFWAYGRLTTLLLIPGLALSLRGSAIQRRAAFAWMIAVVFVHAMPLREVRYLAFVAPLSAFVIVPALRLLSEQRVVAAVIGLLLAVDVAGSAVEASRIRLPFYRHSEARALLAPLSGEPRPRRLYFNLSMLSFVAPGQSPLAADRYHRVFHVGAHHVGELFGYAPGDVRIAPLVPHSLLSATAPEGSVLLFSSEILAHGPTWIPRPPIGIDRFAQGLATLQTQRLHRDSTGAYRAIDRDDQQPDQAAYLLPVALLDQGQSLPLEPRADKTFVLGRPAIGVAPPELTLRAFVLTNATKN